MTTPTTPPLTQTTFRVVMGDTDAAGVIYFAAPLHWAERMFTEYLAEIGEGTSAMLRDGRGFPLVHMDVDYFTPFRLDDRVVARLWIDARTTKSFTWLIEFSPPEGPTAIRVRLTQVHIDTIKWKSIPLTPALASLPVNGYEADASSEEQS